MNYFSEEIIMLNQKVDTKEEALRLLTSQFENKDLVTNAFHEGIINREVNNPTGLQIGDFGVAIPHTDSDKVKKAQLGFLSLENPVKFADMGDPDNEIEVSLIFMLGLKESHDQLDMLQKLMGIFQNEELVLRLKNSNDKEDFKQIIEEAGLISKEK